MREQRHFGAWKTARREVAEQHGTCRPVKDVEPQSRSLMGKKPRETDNTAPAHDVENLGDCRLDAAAGHRAPRLVRQFPEPGNHGVARPYEPFDGSSRSDPPRASVLGPERFGIGEAVVGEMRQLTWEGLRPADRVKADQRTRGDRFGGLCCTNRLMDGFPLSPSGFSPRLS